MKIDDWSAWNTEEDSDGYDTDNNEPTAEEFQPDAINKEPLETVDESEKETGDLDISTSSIAPTTNNNVSSSSGKKNGKERLVTRPHEKRGAPKSQTQALGKLSSGVIKSQNGTRKSSTV